MPVLDSASAAGQDHLRHRQLQISAPHLSDIGDAGGQWSLMGGRTRPQMSETLRPRGIFLRNQFRLLKWSRVGYRGEAPNSENGRKHATLEKPQILRMGASGLPWRNPAF